MKRGRDLYMANALFTRLVRSHVTALVFYETSLMGGDFTHNKPLYMEVVVERNRVRKLLVDGSSSVNIIPTPMFRVIRLTMD